MKNKMDNTGLCTDCLEAISNPVCLDCFLKQIKNWFIGSKIDAKTRQKLLLEIRQEFNREYSDPEQEIVCTLCGRQEVSVCSYCFFLRVNRILKKFSVGKRQMEDFMEVFNYRQWHEDY
jgi:hypothetical protein